MIQEKTKTQLKSMFANTFVSGSIKSLASQFVNMFVNGLASARIKLSSTPACLSSVCLVNDQVLNEIFFRDEIRVTHDQ